MKSLSLTALAAILIATASCGTKEALTPVELVDPFIGTGFHGHTFPGATVPFGAVQLSPDTRMGNWDACGGYHYSDSTIDGFSMTHLSGTGCLDLGDVLFRPVAGTTPLPFSHKNEEASPGYYEVTLTNPSIKVQLTATTHCGMQCYTYPEGTPAVVVIDLNHSLEPGESRDSIAMAPAGADRVEGVRVTTGWTPNHHVFFSTQFSEKFEKAEYSADSTLLTLTFPANVRSVAIRTGVSAVSSANAAANLEAEMPGFDFDAVRAKARAMWAEELGKIEVEGGTLAERRTFYTALYHSMITPYTVSDANGQYRRNNQQIAQLPDSTSRRYSTLSLWDTYRAWHPLMTIINPALVIDIVNSMLDMYDATGELPIWPLASADTKCMIGYHAASVIADAYAKGITGFDPRKALDAMVASSNINAKGSDSYTTLGYIPANEKREAVSLQLEYAYDDWCIATMAQSLGDTVVAKKYFDRARSYANVFDGATRFFRGKRSDGLWMAPFCPQAVDRAFTEATPWQYRFYVPHDVNGMINLFGGREAFTAALDSIFTVSSEIVGEQSDITGMLGQYAHGNEPSHHIAYLYNYVGQPYKTQELTRRLLSEMYSDTPEGLIGNEDCGQMSAWYVMTALGLYPVAPGNGEYAITTPLFPKTTIHLGNGKTLTITANDPAKNHYIRSLSFNGKPIDTNFITHAMLMEGGELKFDLTSEITNRGTAPEAAPTSLTNEEQASVPYIKEDLYLFLDSATATLGTVTPGAEVRFTTDGTEPTLSSSLYTAPLRLTSSQTIKAKAFKQGIKPSATLTVKAEKAELQPAVAAVGLKPGVSYKYVEGTFSRVAQMASRPVVASGIMPEPTIKDARQPDHFGYTFTGYINVPADGVYTFQTKSDDGSTLTIGNRLVVNNDGSHSAVPATGLVPLAKGLHPFTLLYFEDYEGEELSWGWALPGTTEIVPIPASALFTR